VKLELEELQTKKDKTKVILIIKFNNRLKKENSFSKEK